MATNLRMTRRVKLAAEDLTVRDEVLSSRGYEPMGTVRDLPTLNADGTVTVELVNPYGVTETKRWAAERTVHVRQGRRVS